MALNATQVWNGNYGELWHEGKWLSNVNNVSASVTVNKAEVSLVGHLWTQQKMTSLSGSGSISGYMVTTDLIEAIGASVTAGKEFKTSLIFKMADPDSIGGQVYRVTLKNVTFDSIPIANFSAGELVTFELPFTFTEYEINDKVQDV